MKRREFIKGSGRIVFLGLLLGGTALLAGKNKISLEAYCKDKTGCFACRLNTICTNGSNQTPVKDGE